MSKPVISSDGRYVAFRSEATDLVPGDTNGVTDIFVTDTLSGTTLRASTAADGAEGNGRSSMVSISADGRYVAFDSFANNLAPGPGSYSVVYVKDMKTGAITKVSAFNSGENPVISADGRFVYFYSTSSLWVKDMMTGSLSVFASVAGGRVSVSADGHFVAFASSAILVPDDTNERADIYVKDVLTGTITRVSTSSTGAQAITESPLLGCLNPSISADGRFVAFDTKSSTLVDGDTNSNWDVFVKDMLTGVTTRVSTDSTGAQVSSGSYASISGDGRYVAFESTASNLVSGDTNINRDIFVKDTLTGMVKRVSVGSTGSQANGESHTSTLSLNGNYVAFISGASNLVNGDTNSAKDYFKVSSGNAIACTGQAPALNLAIADSRWASYADYQARKLSIDYDLTNAGSSDAFSLSIVNVVSTGGATTQPPPYMLSWMINSGSTSTLTMSYYVPPGVFSFRTTVHATAGDACGQSFSYPSQ
ncbi:MAG: PD40 domain-containing protein [Actinobacteria bacterium]|nr:PD40 domain-containing protein [Actinomycetota bacterium]